jgi:hypothetical protein
MDPLTANLRLSMIVVLEQQETSDKVSATRFDVLSFGFLTRRSKTYFPHPFAPTMMVQGK